MKIDVIVNQLMVQAEQPILNSISKIIGLVFDPITLLFISVMIMGFLFYKKKKKQSIFFACAMGITAILIKGFKLLFSRARPINALIQETSYSFPSGHATIAVVFFGILAILLLENKKQKNYDVKKFIVISKIIFLSLMIGISRIYLRVHWVSDVAAGFLLGGIILVSSMVVKKKMKI